MAIMSTGGPGSQRWGDPVYRADRFNSGMVDWRWTQGVLGRRVIAYAVDLVVIFVLLILLKIAIAILGLITFGLGWVLFGLLPLTAIAYNAVTISGHAQATIGMRMMGVRVVDATTGGPVSLLQAAVHALLFYVAVSTFMLWVVDFAIGLLREDSRVGHDVITGVVLVRAV
jgi:uncharacterized RDD family membrane protein YckC